MTTYKFPLNTVLGAIEGRNVSMIVNQRENFDLQSTQFRVYCDNFSKLIKSHVFSSSDIWKRLNIPNPEDTISNIICILLRRFDTNRYIEFSLYILGYLIIQSYITADNKDYGNTIYHPEKFLDEIKECLTNEEIFIHTAYERYYECAPFFGKMCAFGYKTFLDLYLRDNVFLIGMGLNCNIVHCGMFKSNFAVTMHDFGHYQRLKNRHLQSYEKMVEIYNKILDQEQSIQPGLIYLLFLLIHENSRYSDVLIHINNSVCHQNVRDFIHKNFGVEYDMLPQFQITTPEKDYFKISKEDEITRTFIYFTRILNDLTSEPLA